MAWVCWETSQAESRVWLGQNSQLPFQTSLPSAAPYGCQEEEKNELPRNSFGTVQVEQLSQQFITLIFLNIFQPLLGFAVHGELSCHRGRARAAARHEAKKEPHRSAWSFLSRGITKYTELWISANSSQLVKWSISVSYPLVFKNQRRHRVCTNVLFDWSAVH